jgi:two-component system sensor histidine kinase FlrB
MSSLKNSWLGKHDFSDSPPADLSEINSLKSEVRILKKRIHYLQGSHEQTLGNQSKQVRRFESLLQQLPCGVITLDERGCIDNINSYARKLFTEIRFGETWLTVIQREFSPREDDGHEISLRNGKRVTVDTASLNDGSGQIVILLDLTETRNLQENLSRQERLIEMGKMIASLAHQIRTPLSTAMLYSSQLIDLPYENKRIQHFSIKLKSSLDCINKQINDMLIYVRGDVEPDECLDIAQLLNEIEAYCADSVVASAGRLHIQVPTESVLIRCNKTTFIGALSNLVQNSLQSQSAPVTVGIRAALVDANKLQVRVFDNGPGIDASVRDKIFQQFFTTKTVGTGLGLPIVKTIIQSHGGDIFLDESCTHSGCCFLIELPVQSSYLR